MSEYNSTGNANEPEITAEYINRRVEDWLQRLGVLFKDIKDWAAANGWSVQDETPIPMNEELMQRFGVAAQPQPTLSIRAPKGAAIWIKPKGLWVIGANGRVDIYSQKGAFTLVDTADNFQSPEWVLYRVGERKGQKFDAAQLAGIA